MNWLHRRLRTWWRPHYGAGLLYRLSRRFSFRRYRLVWGTYPQHPGTRHTYEGGWFIDADEAGSTAYRNGAHWYQVFDRQGREVWSSDHDIQVLRRAA